jgi:hypothetical protein
MGNCSVWGGTEENINIRKEFDKGKAPIGTKLSKV